MRHLYFLALVPPPDVAQPIDNIRHEIWQKFGPQHALNSPPHITLVPPFKMVPEKRDLLLGQGTERLGLGLVKPFTLKLSGIGAFGEHTLYISVNRPPALQELHQNAKNLIVNQLDLNLDRPNREYNPHLTLAFKDLKKHHFNEVQQFADQKKLEFNFQVKSVFLLRHSGKRWLLDVEFPFNTH